MISNQQLIHIGAEVIIIGGVAYFLNNKITQNTEIITILAQEIDGLKRVVQTQAHYIRQLIGDRDISPLPEGEEVRDERERREKTPDLPERVPPPLPENLPSPPSPSPEELPPRLKGLQPARAVRTIRPFSQADLVDELQEELAELEANKGEEIDPSEVAGFADVSEIVGGEEEGEEEGIIEQPVTIETLNTDLNLGKTNTRIPSRPRRRNGRR